MSVDRELARSAARLNKHSRRYVARVRLSLAAAMKETRAALQAWYAQGKTPETVWTVRHYRDVLRSLREARRRLRMLEHDTESALRSGHKLHAGLAQTNLTAIYNALSVEFAGSKPPPLPREVWSLSGVDEPLIKRFESSAARYAGNVRRHIFTQLRIGVIKRETVYQMAKRLEPAIKRSVDLPARIGLQVYRQPYLWAERLVRTEVMHAYNATEARALEQMHGELGLIKRWDATADSRTCIMCRDLHGEEVTPGDTYSNGEPHPPAHPHCRCTEIPWDPAWSDLTARDEEIKETENARRLKTG